MTRTSDDTALSIGALARETGVAVATLRMWESRHGFPTSRRAPSGHRRYDATQVDLVRDVMRRRESGARLDSAIALATTTARHSRADSVYAALVRDHPEQPPQRLRKSTLLALSFACEDELVATAARGHLFGAFQTGRNLEAVRHRWSELARTAHGAFALADFPDLTTPGAGPEPGPDGIERVPLPPDAPMRREWAVVNDSPDLPVALCAWELPGQDRLRDRDRVFECVWTLDPRAVRTAAMACAAVAAAAHSARAAELLRGPLAEPLGQAPDLAAATRLMHRIVAYLETAA